MKNRFLLPHACKNIGWIFFIPLLILGAIYILFPNSDIIDRIFYHNNWANEIFVVGLSASMVAVAFSREKDEDEYISALRGRYLSLAFFIDLAILAVVTLAVHDFEYLDFMVIQMFLVLLIFIVTFNVAIWRLRKFYKTGQNEE